MSYQKTLLSLDTATRIWYNVRMKKATYRLTLEFDNGDKLSYGNLTQTKAYDTRKKWEARGWYQTLDLKTEELTRYLTRWKLDSGWQEIND